MWFVRRNNAQFYCAKCYQTGFLPIVEGETVCPYCGEWVWQVRKGVQPLDRAKPITPDCRLPMRAHRPPTALRGRLLARLCIRLFPHYVSRWVARREKRSEAHIHDLFRQLKTCRSREQYEVVLGKPVYAVSGRGFGRISKEGVVDQFDVVEHYDCGDCSVELHFKNDTLREQWAYMRPSTLWIEFIQHQQPTCEGRGTEL